MLLMIGDLGKAGPMKRRVASVAINVLPGHMRCREFHAFIIDYSENRLQPDIKRRFKLHLDICSTCRTHLASYLKSIELSRMAVRRDNAGESVEAPQDLVNAILASILLSAENGPANNGGKNSSVSAAPEKEK